MTQTYRIPDELYAGGTPRLTEYAPGVPGLTYHETGERAFELAAAFGGDPRDQRTTVALVSPYVLPYGIQEWIDGNLVDRLHLVAVDLEQRTITVREE